MNSMSCAHAKDIQRGVQRGSVRGGCPSDGTHVPRRGGVNVTCKAWEHNLTSQWRHLSTNEFLLPWLREARFEKARGNACLPRCVCSGCPGAASSECSGCLGAVDVRMQRAIGCSGCSGVRVQACGGGVGPGSRLCVWRDGRGRTPIHIRLFIDKLGVHRGFQTLSGGN